MKLIILTPEKLQELLKQQREICVSNWCDYTPLNRNKAESIASIKAIQNAPSPDLPEAKEWPTKEEINNAAHPYSDYVALGFVAGANWLKTWFGIK